MRMARSGFGLLLLPLTFLPILLASCTQLQVVALTGADICLPGQTVCQKPSVMALASDLDHLEHHIDKYGSVVAQQPSVWGQARMTRHREQVEIQLSKELTTFERSLQGSLSRSDQAYFANAFTLSAAISGRSAGLFAARPRVVVNNSTATGTTVVEERPTGTVGIPPLPVEGTPPTPAAGALAAPGGGTTFDAFKADRFKRTDVRAGDQLKFDAQQKMGDGISIEPTVYLDQKARYLNHLNELRRINEGDDTADSPGYALNLVRIPVSVLPGNKTREGYGAEVTMTMIPHLSDELLPTTFRNLILNDLVDQLGVPMAQLINDPDYLINLLDEEQYAALTCEPLAPPMPPAPPMAVVPIIQSVPAIPLPEKLTAPKGSATKNAPKAGNAPKTANNAPQGAANNDNTIPTQIPQAGNTPRPGNALRPRTGLAAQIERGERSPRASKSQMRLNMALQRIAPEATTADAKAEVIALSKKLAEARRSRPAVSVTKVKRAFLPFPSSQLHDVLGQDIWELMVRRTYQAFERDPASNYPCNGKEEYVHLPSVQGYLREELSAAHKFLSESPGHDLWGFCTPQLAQLIRGRNACGVKKIRDDFFAAANRIAVPAPAPEAGPPPCVPTTRLTVMLAWAIIVDSVLLNEQLITDMREAAANKGCGCLPSEPHPYYLPNPPAAARQAFNAYVQCRWPIHVFALDPANQQQNIADTYSARREMQLAMSLAFASGQISATNMMRYARRIELDMETIDLNNTAVGFSHGNETFGWRFYPRYQTPEIEGNATVVFRDLFMGGPRRDTMLRQRRLEPGIRECVAIVIMPSFVPTATLHTSSNWFKLTHPKCKELNSADAMRLSKAVKTIQTCAPNVGDADCFRDGDYHRLLMKARQLEARLPLQSTQVQIPFENTLGGFAMFNNGVTDLAPELYGWYGAAEVKLDRATTVFLVGNHFSVHQTRVIAGGQNIPPETHTELLSRQVMKVTIPAGAVSRPDGDRNYVDVQVATPYGVTAPLMIPVCSPKAAAPPAVGDLSWRTPKLELAFEFKPQELSIVAPAATPGGKPSYFPMTLSIPGDTAVPATVTGANITLVYGGAFAGLTAVSLEDVPYDGQSFKITGPQLKDFVDVLYATFRQRFRSEANPPVDVTFAQTVIQYKGDTGAIPGQRKTSNNLTVSWVKVPN